MPFSNTNVSSSIEHAQQLLLKQLSTEELELAAKTSYAYRRQQQKQSDDNHDKNESSSPVEEQQGEKEKEYYYYYATIMAERYLKSKSNDVDKALKNMKRTFEFRQNIVDMDQLLEANHDVDNDYHMEISKFLACSPLYVQGYDKNGHATLLFTPRLVTHHHHDAMSTVRGFVFNLEKAIACSEAKSKSSSSTVNVMIDCQGFSLANAPPMATAKLVLQYLRQHYVGHIHAIYIVNAPRAFVWLWNTVQNFVGTKTKKKIHFVNSHDEQLVSSYDKEQATTWMRSDGMKNQPFNVEEYLRLPFDQAFDE